MLKLFAFSRHGFASVDEARALVDFWRATPEPPQRFAWAEPVRQKLDGLEEEAARLLANEQVLFLARGKPASTWMFVWNDAGGAAQWYAEFAEAAAPTPDTWAAFFARFPVVWAGVAPQAHWKARHWHVEESDDGGEVESKVGLDAGAALPGLFWLTAFGGPATEHFGRARLLALPVQRSFDLGPSGVLLQTDAAPPPGPTPGTRESVVLDALGREHFFDIAAPHRPHTPIPRLWS